MGHPTSKKLETVKEVPYLFLLPQYVVALIVVVLGTFPGLITPYLNTILSELQLKALPFTSSAVLETENGSYNGLVVIVAFASVFMLILFVLRSLSSNKVKEAKDRFDIAYCGEVPNEGTHLHYGFSMGKELRRVGFIGTILKNSSSYFYEFISKQLFSFAQLLGKIYSGNLSANFNIAAIFILALLWWSLK